MSKLNVILISSILLVLHSLVVAGNINQTTGLVRNLFLKLDKDYQINHVLNSFDSCLGTKLPESDSKEARLFHCIPVAVDSFYGNTNWAVQNSTDLNSAVQKLYTLFLKWDRDYQNANRNLNAYATFKENIEQETNETQEEKLGRSISAVNTLLRV